MSGERIRVGVLSKVDLVQLDDFGQSLSLWKFAVSDGILLC